MKRILLVILTLGLVRPIIAQRDLLKDTQSKNSSGDFFDDFVSQLDEEFNSFREKLNQEYAAFMENPWKEHNIKKAFERPIEKDITPVRYDKQKDEQQNREIKVEIIPIKQDVKSHPKPVEPIKENEETAQYITFDYYGTPLKVRWEKANEFKLTGSNEKAFAKAYRVLTSETYNNLLFDCLSLRKKYLLCDWAYYKMLEKMAEEVCGKDTNEAVFLQGFLYHQSGYMMRFAFEPENKKLHLLTRVKGTLFDCNYTQINGKYFFLFDGSKAKNLKICDQSYPGEQEMNLSIDALPKLAVKLSSNRNIKSMSYSVEAQTNINENLISFFNEYPSSYNDNNFMTRWAYYANTPVSPELREGLYPQLKSKITNAGKLLAANMLLNWVQMGLTYEYDDKVWGHDRAFFAEESLYYPFSDCEDRSILYSHLVRDLLGLDVVLVYYPNHLATAVCFENEEAKGDFIMVGSRKFTVADPTYFNAPIGRTPSSLDNSTAKVILLKRNSL